MNESIIICAGNGASMLELTNLSNADCDVENILRNDTDSVPAIVREHGLDGIEFMLCTSRGPTAHTT